MYHDIISSLAQKAIKHINNGDSDKARHCLEEAYDIAKIGGDATELVCIMRDLANMEMKFNNFDRAEWLLLHAMTIKGALDFSYLSVKDSIACLMARNGDIDSAIGMLRVIKNDLKSISDDHKEFIKAFDEHLDIAIGHLCAVSESEDHYE
jgi:hypothetical protein